MQLACERQLGSRTSMRSALRGPVHQLAVRMRINNCTHSHNNNIIMAQATNHAPCQAASHAPCQAASHAPYQAASHAPCQAASHAPCQAASHAPCARAQRVCTLVPFIVKERPGTPRVTAIVNLVSVATCV